MLRKTITRKKHRHLSLFVISSLLLSIVCAFSFYPCRTAQTQTTVPTTYPAIQEAINSALGWNNTYGGTSDDEPWAVVQTSDGGYALAGRTLSFGAGVEDVWLVKTSADGDVQWNQTCGGTDEDYARSAVETSDGGYALAGSTLSFGAGNSDFWLVKTARGVSTIIVPDDYSTIQEAINAANSGDTIFVKSGLYYEHIIVNKAVQLMGENSSTTVIDGNLTGTVVRVTSDNVKITGFTIQRSGSVMFPNFDAGISLNGTRGCEISTNNIVDNGCFGIHLANSDQNMVSENYLTRNAMYAIDLTTSNNNTIASNTAIFNPNIGIGMHTSSRNNMIRGNTLMNNTYGIDAARASNNTIVDNYLANNSETQIWIQDYAINNIVCGNNVTGGRYCIKIEAQANNNTITGNILTDSRVGIQILNARYTEIRSNTLTHIYGSNETGWDAGIRLDYAGYTKIHSNLITDNWRGILLYTTSSQVSIYNNNVTGNEFGVRVYGGGSHYLNLSDNIVMNNRGYGLDLSGYSSGSNYATITRNLIINNSWGIELGRYSNYHTISQNNISRNRNGLWIERYSGAQNKIYQNNIADNDQQVYIYPGQINIWDGGYASGGNYWSNYTGVDACRGQDQNLLGSDGVGDTPHIIDSNNRDNYPLMAPWFWTPNDVAVEAVTLSKNVVGQGHNMHASVTVANQGFCTEGFNITLYSNAMAVETREVALLSGDWAVLIFTWNTLGFAYGNYTIWVQAEPVPGEVYTADNTYVAGVVTVTIQGDVDGDFFVNITDATTIGLYWMQLAPPAPSKVDISGDGIINIKDATIIGVNWLKHA